MKHLVPCEFERTREDIAFALSRNTPSRELAALNHHVPVGALKPSWEGHVSGLLAGHGTTESALVPGERPHGLVLGERHLLGFPPSPLGNFLDERRQA